MKGVYAFWIRWPDNHISFLVMINANGTAIWNGLPITKFELPIILVHRKGTTVTSAHFNIISIAVLHTDAGVNSNQIRLFYSLFIDQRKQNGKEEGKWESIEKGSFIPSFRPPNGSTSWIQTKNLESVDTKYNLPFEHYSWRSWREDWLVAYRGVPRFALVLGPDVFAPALGNIGRLQLFDPHHSRNISKRHSMTRRTA